MNIEKERLLQRGHEKLAWAVSYNQSDQKIVPSYFSYQIHKHLMCLQKQLLAMLDGKKK
jgi:hypothetical protein